MMEQTMERVQKWQREVEINRRSLEEKRKEREKEVLRQLRALQTVAQQCKEMKLNQDLQQAKNDSDGLRAELDNAIAVKHHFENNSNELTKRLCRAEEALLASQSKQNELRRNFEEMKKEKNLLCCQSDEKTQKIHQLEEALKIAQHLLTETRKNAEEMKNKSLSQKIELEAQEAELQHLKNNNKLLQDSVQELQLENGTLKKALEEEKLDNLKSRIQPKKQNGFARTKMKTWMKSCADEVAISLHENEPEYELDGLPEVVKKGFPAIPIVKTDPYILCRTTFHLRTSPRLAAQSQKLSPGSQLLRKGRSDNLGEICKPTAGGSKSQKDRSDFVCTKCKLVSILEEKVRGLEKQVSTLRCIRENEDFLDRCQEMLLRPQCSEDSEQAQQGQKDCEEVWQHVTSRRRKRSVHAPAMEIQFYKAGVEQNIWTRYPLQASVNASGENNFFKVDDTQQCEAETAIEPMESSSRSLCMNEQPTKTVVQTSRENINTHKGRYSLSTQTSPEQNEEDQNCIIL
ncbi:centromere protein F-like isoform X1 [Chrysemys picta bellii]|uniref:centromere protein F-like isoform X1 n=1 Tax=Chrysemys picta bellii TaxID=8478 RepID=UPI0032B26DA2